jgi:type VI secretion system secreted protein VgrG
MSSKDKFVASQLKDEGGANYVNIKVQREIIANGGMDIGICGACGADYERVYDEQVKGKAEADIDLDKVFTDIGAFFRLRREGLSCR